MRPRQINGQSTIEYMLVAILVILSILIGGPYILRSVNAHFKLWDEAAQASINDHLIEARPEQLNIIVPGCTSNTKTPLDCGLKAGNVECLPTEMLSQISREPAGCDFGFETYVCDENPICCSRPTRTPTCWRNAASAPHLSPSVPETLISSGFKNTCSVTDRVYTFACGNSAGLQLCKADTSSDDGDRNCTPVCKIDQLKDGSGNTIAMICPGTDSGLSTDTPISFVDTCTGTSRCQATCLPGWHQEDNTCVPDASCSDNKQNQGETGVDCGGPCAACPGTPTNFNCQDYNGRSLTANKVWKMVGDIVYYVGSTGPSADTYSCVATFNQRTSVWTSAKTCKYGNLRQCKNSPLSPTLYSEGNYPPCPGYIPAGDGCSGTCTEDGGFCLP